VLFVAQCGSHHLTFDVQMAGNYIGGESTRYARADSAGNASPHF
jgi:hypothetical protein